MGGYLDKTVQVDHNFKPFEKPKHHYKDEQSVKSSVVSLEQMSKNRDKISRFSGLSTSQLIERIKSAELEIDFLGGDDPERTAILQTLISELRNELNCR